MEVIKRLGTFQWLIQKIFETAQPNYWGMCAAAYTNLYGAATVNPYHNLCPPLGRSIFDQGGELTGNLHTIMGDSLLYPQPLGRGAALNTGNFMSAMYLNWDWWVQAMITDPGNGATIAATIDTGYLIGFNQAVASQRPYAWWPVVAGGVVQGQAGQGSPCAQGGNQNCSALRSSDIATGANTVIHWMFASPAEQTAILQGYADASLALLNSKTTAQWQAYFNASSTASTSCTDAQVPLMWRNPFADSICAGWRSSLPIMKQLGVSNTTLNSLVTRLTQIFDTDFAGRMWPLSGQAGRAQGFAADLATTVTLQDLGDGKRKWWRTIGGLF